MYPPPELRTSHTELLGTTAGIIITAIVAALGLVVLVGLVFLVDLPARGQRQTKGNAERKSPGQGGRPSERLEDRHVPEGGHPHGTPSSWLVVAMVTAAFIAGGVAIIIHVWWLLWACIGIVVLAIPAGKVAGIMDDTVAWGANQAGADDLPAGQDGDALPAGQRVGRASEITKDAG